MDPNKQPTPLKNSAKAERDCEANQYTRGPWNTNWRPVQMTAVGRPLGSDRNNEEAHKEDHRDTRPGSSGLSSSKITANEGQNFPGTASSNKSGFHPVADVNTPNGACPTCSVEDRDLGSNIASSSGQIAADADNIVKESRKRPSSLKLNMPNVDDDSSSDTGNDDYSLGSEDGCIYTYRGGEHLADLPSSFFSLDMGLPLDRHLPVPNYPVAQAGNAREGSRASSPDMDFLEMDFDPGPSNEVDTGDESTPDADLEINMPEEIEPVQGPSNHVDTSSKPAQVVHESHSEGNVQPSTSRTVSKHVDTSEHTHHVVCGPYITHVNARGDHILVRRTMSHGMAPVGAFHTNGDMLGRDKDTYERAAFVYHSLKATATATVLIADKTNKYESATEKCEPGPSTSTATVSCVEPPRSMIWSEEVACERQVTQIGTSACGATAVINVFNALGVPVDIERINTAVGTRQRANSAPLPRYILSRSVAGCTAADLVNGIQIASGGLVTARFFPTYPERAMSLSHFIADWIALGGVPILTLNLQVVNIDGDVPDAWHHQMVFGVSPQGIYLTNPLECTRESVLWSRLVCPSVLLVHQRDIVSRFNEDTDLTPLMFVPDARFNTMNVFGQVVNVLREFRSVGGPEQNVPAPAPAPRTRYVRIPAAYQAGVTIAVLTGSEAHRRLMVAPQNPVIAPHERNDKLETNSPPTSYK